MIKYIFLFLQLLTFSLYASLSYAIDASDDDLTLPEGSKCISAIPRKFSILEPQEQKRILNTLYHEVQKHRFTNAIHFFKRNPSPEGFTADITCRYCILKGILCYTSLEEDVDPEIGGATPYHYARACLVKALNYDTTLSWESRISLHIYLASISLKTEQILTTAISHLRTALLYIPTTVTKQFVNLHFIIGYYAMLDGNPDMARHSFNHVLHALQNARSLRHSLFGLQEDQNLEKKTLIFLERTKVNKKRRNK